jgi:hypothetical protein
MIGVLLGSRFATWLDVCSEGLCVVKSMDVAPPGREVTACWREFLGNRLATRLGLAVPATQLQCDSRYGRVSVQRYIAGASAVTRSEFHRIALSRRGMRILSLDFISRNRDRRPANLLRRNDVVFPIDYNVAFDFSGDTIRFGEAAGMIARWFSLEGIARLKLSAWNDVYGEARRAERLLSDSFVEHAVALIPRAFLGRADRSVLLAGIRRRRDALTAILWQWWDDTVLPLNRLTKGDVE